jgi:AraC-like DNA-binding protein
VEKFCKVKLMAPLASSVSSTFVKAFLAAAEIEVHDHCALLCQSGIAPEVLQAADGRVAEEQFVQLYRLIAMRLDDELPKLLSHPLRSGAMKLAALAVMDSPVLEVSMNRFARLYRLLVRDFELHFMREADLGIMQVREPESGLGCKKMAIELSLKVVHGFHSWLAARQVPLLRVDFAFPKPPYASDFQNMFPAPVFFDQPCSQLVFESRHLQWRVTRNVGDLHQYLSALPGSWMFLRKKERLASQQIREYLLYHGMANAQIEQVANALNVSVRTLCRRLEEECTVFRRIKDEVRRDIALERLTNSRASLASIAAELGFVDSSSFHRAFRAWTGKTPNAYRTQVSGADQTLPVPKLGGVQSE